MEPMKLDYKILKYLLTEKIVMFYIDLVNYKRYSECWKKIPVDKWIKKNLNK
jgi:hypothetical protein